MKRYFLSSFWLAALLLVSFGPIGALEVEFTGGINNFTFHPDRVTAHKESTNYKTFQEYPFGYFDLTIKGEVSEKMGINIHAQRDNILRNSLNAIVWANMDYLSVEFGPFIGIGDRADKPDLGVTGSIQVAYPGIAFFSVHGTSSLGVGYEFMSKNHREVLETRLGFWLPNMIATLSAGSKRYTNQLEEKTIRDELARFMFSADFYNKNLPLRVRFDIGYEVLSRFYGYGSAREINDELNAVFLGLDVRWQFSRNMRFIAGFEIPVYYTAVEPMTSPKTHGELYKFTAGVAYTTF